MRALHLSIYVVLILGAVTMVYPFMIMLSGSMKSGVDIKDFDAFPKFFSNDTILYRKHIEGLFNEGLNAMKIAYDTETPTFEKIDPPEHPDAKLVAEWNRFLDESDIPDYTYTLGYIRTPVSQTLPSCLRSFKKELISRYGGSIEKLNADLGTEFVDWNGFYILPEDFLPRRNKPVHTPLTDAFRVFKAEQPRSHKFFFSLQGFFRILFLKTQYTREVEEYNRAHGTTHTSYDSVRLTRRLPNGPAKVQEDWETFVRYTLNLLWVRVDESAAPLYRDFLRAKYLDIGTLNRNYKTDFAAFDEIPLIQESPGSGLPLSDWDTFIKGWKDPDTGKTYMPDREALRIESIDFMFRDYLAETYGTVTELNKALGTDLGGFEDIDVPQRDAHYLAFLDIRSSLRREFATRNYVAVIDYMVLHGRGIINTVIYCLLAVLSALIVNPLAAYAMSRYRMPATYKILLFMLLTMAFPPMVTQIPVFLMLRDFKLLNTFAALVLPGLAHGYSIFLLKGFFDSLPRELYESASIDGASEWTMFWQITMSLSKPILAVIALQAFNIAYSNFMFALLICQDTKMWTLMVWLYQLQQNSGQAVMYASLIIAAVPTFIIFLFCQNIIMRGIVVPVEK
ncbi:MAG: ABC transporter permease subunit [Verrucomicrobia bacterium]|nr:ABC transporter permease subunit [Verrucomicrobiota bacterium]